MHMSVGGFIASALLIQAISTAGVMPTAIWVAEPGYALIVCLGLVILSASILFSLRRLLTEDTRPDRRKQNIDPSFAELARGLEVPLKLMKECAERIRDVETSTPFKQNAEMIVRTADAIASFTQGLASGDPGAAQPPALSQFDAEIQALRSLYERMRSGQQAPTGPENLEAPLALVVEANRTTRKIMEKTLERAGFRCTCVQNDQAALETFRTHTAAVVVGSIETARAYRDLYPSGGAPVIVLAEDRSTETRQRCLEAGASASLARPLDPLHLAEAILGLVRESEKELPVSPTVRPRAKDASKLPKLEAQPLDERALGDLEKLGGSEFVRDIVAQFVGDAATVLVSLRAAVAERDPKTFREQAHALRSCAANVGAQNVYRMCLAWRKLDSHEIAASGMKYMEMLESEFQRVRTALEPMLDEGERGSASDSAAA
ncbi:MAG: hypothetical protein NVSMB26_06250 [Beijerinckiaceae bacterium]